MVRGTGDQRATRNVGGLAAWKHQRSTTAAEALAGPQDADPSFGTEQQYVRGGGYSEAAQEAWLRRRRSLLPIEDPVFYVDDTYTVWREFFADKNVESKDGTRGTCGGYR